jgi:hypothetical protein
MCVVASGPSFIRLSGGDRLASRQEPLTARSRQESMPTELDFRGCIPQPDRPVRRYSSERLRPADGVAYRGGPAFCRRTARGGTPIVHFRNHRERTNPAIVTSEPGSFGKVIPRGLPRATPFGGHGPPVECYALRRRLRRHNGRRDLSVSGVTPTRPILLRSLPRVRASVYVLLDVMHTEVSKPTMQNLCLHQRQNAELIPQNRLARCFEPVLQNAGINGPEIDSEF